MNYLSEWPQLYHTELLMTLCQKSDRVSPEYICISGKEKGFPFESEPEGKQ